MSLSTKNTKIYGWWSMSWLLRIFHFHLTSSTQQWRFRREEKMRYLTQSILFSFSPVQLTLYLIWKNLKHCKKVTATTLLLQSDLCNWCFNENAEEIFIDVQPRMQLFVSWAVDRVYWKTMLAFMRQCLCNVNAK